MGDRHFAECLECDFVASGSEAYCVRKAMIHGLNFKHSTQTGPKNE